MLRSIVPPAGPPRVLALAQLADWIGLGAYLVCTALYFTTIVGLSPTEIGFGLTVAWGAGLLVGTPLGHLADRKGPRGVAVMLAVIGAFAVGAFPLVRSGLAFVVVACIYASSQCGLNAARQALLAGLVEPARRTEVRAYLQSMANAGIAMGAALGGVALYVGTAVAYQAVFVLGALAVVGCAGVLLRLPPVPGAPSGDGPALAVLRDRPYALLAFLSMVLHLHLPMMSVAIPLWIALRTEAPVWLVSALLLVNTMGVLLFQVRVARRVHDLRTAARFVRYAGLVLVAACGVYAASASGSSALLATGVLLAAAGLQVFGEMLHSAGAWEISFGLAPAGRHGQYQGFFGSGFAVARMVGPFLLTTLVISWGLAGWLVLAALFLTAGAAMAPAVRWAEGKRRAAAVYSGHSVGVLAS